MAWCTHCLRTCSSKEIIGDFTACHTCGKVLGEVSVPKKNKQYGTIGLDSSSSNSGIYESKILTYAFDQANDDNHPIQGKSHKNSYKTKWCTHCLKACRTECSGDFLSCSWCGKVLGDVSVGSSSNLRKSRYERFQKRKKENKKHGTVGLDSSSSSSSSSHLGIHERNFLTEGFSQANDDNQPIQGLSHNKSYKTKWCTHCLKACRIECSGSFISCSWCGEVLGEVVVRSSSNLRKNRYERIQRRKKNKHGTTYSMEIVKDLSARDKEM